MRLNGPRLPRPRRPRCSQSGQEKRRRNFSRKGERAPLMLPLTNQFHDLFECLSVFGHKKYFCARLEASICRAAFVIFLYEGVTCAQSQTNIRMSRGTRLLRLASQGLSRSTFLKTFAAIIPDPTETALGLQGSDFYTL